MDRRLSVIRSPRGRSLKEKARAWDDLSGLVSLLLFLGGTALIFRSWEFGLIVTASLGFHELGHAAAIGLHGLKSRISFGLVGAWTWSPLQERQKLSDLQNIFIHLAGPLFSLLLAAVAVALRAYFPAADQHLGVLANFSAQVGLLNLLPLGALTDGGKIVRRLVAPLDAGSRAEAALLPLSCTALMLVACSLLSSPNGGWRSILLIGLWLGGSLIFEARRPAPAAPLPARQVTRTQAFALVGVAWGLLLLSVAIIAATPFWLEPGFVMGMVNNVLVVLRLIV